MPRKTSITSLETHKITSVFKEALRDQDVIKHIQSAVCGQLSKQVGELRDILLKRNEEISSLKEKVAALELKAGDAEQYSRRTVIDGENEDLTRKWKYNITYY